MAGKLKLEGKLASTALEMLKKIARVFDDNNIRYVLEGGTLLGIIRESRLLPWDNDMDLTVMEDQTQKLKKVKLAIWKVGYRSRFRYFKEDIGPFRKGEIRMFKIATRKWFFFKDKALLDVFIKREIDGKAYWTVGAKNPVLKSVESKFYKEIKKHTFSGMQFSIPRDTDEYLTCRYGSWREPKKEWNFKKDDKAIIK